MKSKPNSLLSKTARSIRMSVYMAVGLLAACGGGGGDGGTSNAAAIANRYTVNLVTEPGTSVFYNGVSTTAFVTLVKNCSTSSTSSSSSLVTSCGGTQPIDDISGQPITLTSSDPAAVSFTPATAITDSDGKAQFVVNAASPNVAGLVQVTANARLSGNDYRKTVALGVNNQVDKSIGLGDDGIFQDVDRTKNCSNYLTLLVDVKSSAGIVQNSSVIQIDTITSANAEGGVKDLGVFGSLGRVWLIQVRPPIATCKESGTTPSIGNVDFVVNPGDGSPVYRVGYRLKFNT